MWKGAKKLNDNFPIQIDTWDTPRKQGIVKEMIPLLKEASEAAANGNMQREVQLLNKAMRQAKSASIMQGGRLFLEARDKLLQAGLLFIGATPIGDIVPESPWVASARQQSLFGGSGANSGPINIWSDRVICGETVVPIDRFTSASLFVDGVDQITQRPTLTRMALLAPLPGLALIPGLALQKKTREDRRRVQFSIQSADWQFSAQISPAAIPVANGIAERVNAISAKLENEHRAFEPVTVDSIADELLKLGALLDSGRITEEEFMELKRRLIVGD